MELEKTSRVASVGWMKSLLAVASWGVHGPGWEARNTFFSEIPSNPPRLTPEATVHSNAELPSELDLIWLSGANKLNTSPTRGLL